MPYASCPLRALGDCVSSGNDAQNGRYVNLCNAVAWSGVTRDRSPRYTSVKACCRCSDGASVPACERLRSSRKAQVHLADEGSWLPPLFSSDPGGSCESEGRSPGVSHRDKAWPPPRRFRSRHEGRLEEKCRPMFAHRSLMCPDQGSPEFDCQGLKRAEQNSESKQMPSSVAGRKSACLKPPQDATGGCRIPL